MALPLNKAVGILIVLIAIMITAGSLIMPFFATTYEYGFGTEPCAKDGCTSADTGDSLLNPYCVATDGTETACTSCNTTTGYESFLDNCHSLRNATNSTGVCINCTSFGFKTSVTGLMLFILFIGIIAFIIFLMRQFPRFK